MEKKMAFKLVLGALCACLTVVSFSANAATVYATNSNEITRYDAVTGVLQDSFGFAYNGGGLAYGDGYIYSTYSNEITRYDAVTGVLQDSFGFAYNGGGLAYGDGYIYSTYSNEITRYDAVTGVLQDSFGFAHNGGGLVFVPSSVPIPPALWLFGSGLLGLVGLARRKKS